VGEQCGITTVSLRAVESRSNACHTMVCCCESILDVPQRGRSASRCGRGIGPSNRNTIAFPGGAERPNQRIATDLSDSRNLVTASIVFQSGTTDAVDKMPSVTMTRGRATSSLQLRRAAFTSESRLSGHSLPCPGQADGNADLRTRMAGDGPRVAEAVELHNRRHHTL
jgi:hypothetical protein